MTTKHQNTTTRVTSTFFLLPPLDAQLLNMIHALQAANANAPSSKPLKDCAVCEKTTTRRCSQCKVTSCSPNSELTELTCSHTGHLFLLD
jgi:hypothetical protein